MSGDGRCQELADWQGQRGSSAGERGGTAAQRASPRARTFAVVTKAHLGLAEANGVFPSTDAIVLLKLGLLDILFRDCASAFVARASPSSPRTGVRGRAISGGAKLTWLGK